MWWKSYVGTSRHFGERHFGTRLGLQLGYKAGGAVVRRVDSAIQRIVIFSTAAERHKKQ